jgi:hypothetical protein
LANHSSSREDRAKLFVEKQDAQKSADELHQSSMRQADTGLSSAAAKASQIDITILGQQGENKASFNGIAGCGCGCDGVQHSGLRRSGRSRP